MSFLVPVLIAVGTAVAAQQVGKALSGKPKAPTATRLPTRNGAADALASSDRFNRRRGGAANAILGARGAESSAGGKTQLGA